MTISITSTPTICSRSIDISPKSVIEDLVGSNLELGDLDEEKEKKTSDHQQHHHDHH